MQCFQIDHIYVIHRLTSTDLSLGPGGGLRQGFGLESAEVNWQILKPDSYLAIGFIDLAGTPHLRARPMYSSVGALLE